MECFSPCLSAILISTTAAFLSTGSAIGLPSSEYL